MRGQVVHHGRELGVELEINNGRANRARINRAPAARPRDVLGILRTVLFAPEDLALVRGDPGERRRFLDDLLVTRFPRYAAVRADYERVLKQRSALLKSRARPAATCAPSTCGTATSPRTARRCWPGGWSWWRRWRRWPWRRSPRWRRPPTRSRSPTAAASTRTPPPGAVTGLPPAAAELEALLLEALARMRRQEVERGVCLVGPHRDDLDLRLGEGPAKGYASHGESWALALALRLASYRLLCADDVEPVLILDDVFAELDSRRRRALADVAARAEQVLITAAVAEDVPDGLGGVRFAVSDGTVDRLPQEATSGHQL